jgi:chemotaxis protein methyltransferase CheR
MIRLNDSDFTQLRDYLRRTAGLEFDESRRLGLSAVLVERLRASGQHDVRSYVRLLDRADGTAERQHLLDAVTIQKTHFHRARPQIDALRDHLLPAVLGTASRHGRAVTVWSAGCSTGEEAYTIAMLALEAREQMFGTDATPPIRVVGTDVSLAALDLARAARYSGRTIALAEPDAVTRWLRPAGDGDHVVRDEVRELVEFAHHNLVTEEPPFPPGTVDLVVCRNVTIYFSRETTRELVSRFRTCLTPRGWLMLGPAETLWQLSDAFSLAAVGEAFAYRPIAAAPAAPQQPPAAQPQRPRAVPAVRPLRQQSLGQRPAVGDADAVKKEPVTAADGLALLADARTAFEQARYADAAVLSAHAAAADPLLTEAYVVCGQAHATLGRDGDALGPLGRAVYLDARAGHAWFLLAGSLGRTGDRAGASRAYRAAAEALPCAPPEAVHGLLDGTPVEQLVQLCHRLADDLQGHDDDLRRGA